MKNKVSFVLLLVFVSLCSCHTHNHYRAYLASYDTGKLASEDAQRGEFKILDNNFIYVNVKSKKYTQVKITIEDVKLGYLHYPPPSNSLESRFYNSDQGVEHRKRQATGGKEIWIIVSGQTENPNDPLGKSVQKFSKATNIKTDMESFSYVPLDEEEATIFDGVMSSSYRLRFKIYEVDMLKLKSVLYQAANRSVSAWLLEGARIAGENMSNILLREVVSYVDERMKEDLFIEKILLTADADIVFDGQVDLLVMSSQDIPTESNRNIVNLCNSTKDHNHKKDVFYLYDFFRSRVDAKYNPGSSGVKIAEKSQYDRAILSGDVSDYSSVYAMPHGKPVKPADTYIGFSITTSKESDSNATTKAGQGSQP